MESRRQSFRLEKYDQLIKVSPLRATKDSWPIRYIQKISSPLRCPEIHWWRIRTNLPKFHLKRLQAQCYSERIDRQRMEPSLPQGTTAKIQRKVFQRSSRHHDNFGCGSPRCFLQQFGTIRWWSWVPNRRVFEDKVPWGQIKKCNGYPQNDRQFETQAEGVRVIQKCWPLKWWTDK